MKLMVHMVLMMRVCLEVCVYIFLRFNLCLLYQRKYVRRDSLFFDLCSVEKNLFACLVRNLHGHNRTKFGTLTTTVFHCFCDPPHILIPLNCK